MRLFALLACGLVLPLLAQEPCPWLNSATSGGALGGSVTVTVTHPSSNKNDATCEFVHESEPAQSLLIEVTTMTNVGQQFPTYLARCNPNPTPVRAIGNTAVACGLTNETLKVSEQIVSRVRERALVVRLSTNDKSASHDALREKARSLAEQVAGNLF